MISDLIGQVFDNDGAALKQALRAYLNIRHLCHLGNYVFMALLPEDKYASVSTTPVDEESEKIEVVSISISQAENLHVPQSE